MTMKNIPGGDFYFPAPFVLNGGNGFPALTSATIDATGEKIAFSGQVQFPDRSASSRNLSRVQFMFGTVTKAGGSGLTVSLQDVSLTAGPPKQPDGTQDQTVAIANGDASFASNTWYRTGTFSASRTVSHGDKLSVVIEYDGSGRLSTDTVSIVAVNYGSGSRTATNPISALYTTSWGYVSAYGFPICVLEFDDGTYGSLGFCDPAKTITSVTYNSSTGTYDEYGRVINLPFKFTVAGIWANGAPAAAAGDFDLVLYEGTTSRASVSLDGNHFDTVNNNVIIGHFPTPYECAANTDYVIAFKPTTINNVKLNYYTVDSNGLLAVTSGGINSHMVKRLDAGSWTDDTTSCPYMGVIISQVDDGASAGGGVGPQILRPNRSFGNRM